MEPRVTIVVTQRERMSLTERSLESILSDRSQPFHLVYVDGGAPPRIADYLRRRSVEENFHLIRRDTWLWPNVARNLAMRHVTTPYVVFIDNDVLVEQGWLGKLVAAADETGAALVGPIYLWSDGEAVPTIHMAGGVTTHEQTPEGLAIHERHNRFNEPEAVRRTLARESCDFLEYHCMMARTDFVRDVGGLDERIVSVHEHIDLALLAKQRNLQILTEPASAITYLAFVPMQASDLAFYRWRWSEEAVADSLNAFATKWKTVRGGPSYKGVLDFAVRHREDIDLLLPRLAQLSTNSPPKPDSVSQSLYQLLCQATQRGYTPEQALQIGKAYNAASILFGDGFRPCGRPFMLHLTGTASVLVAHGFAMRVILTGMLHATYSHARLGAKPLAGLNELQRQLRSAFGNRVEASIARYARFQANPDEWRTRRPVDQLTIDDAETLAVAIANEIDEHMAGEFAFTAKHPLSDAWYAYAQQATTALGLQALGQQLTSAAQQSRPVGFDLRRQQTASYRHLNGKPVAMTHPYLPHWNFGDMNIAHRPEGLRQIAR